MKENRRRSVAFMKELLYGAAYYDEYMPYERLAKDVSMMQKADRRIHMEYMRASGRSF